MSALLEVPRLDDLIGLGVDVKPSEQMGVASVTAWANDGNSVTLTWDEIAGSVSVRWTDGNNERLTLERETASKVSIREKRGTVQFYVWCRSEGLGGKLVVQIGERVTVRDALLIT